MPYIFMQLTIWGGFFMRRFLLVLLSIIALATACVPSLNPLYTKLDLRQNPAMVGAWISGDSTEIWEFGLAKDSIFYDLIETEKDEPRHFEAHLLELNKALYLDTYPTEESGNDFYKLHLVRAHIFGKIKISPDTLTLSLLDGDWLKDMITKGEIKIGHEDVQDGILLTAPTADLQALVKKYANDDKAFSSPTYLIRKK